MGRIGLGELVVIALIAILLFGAGRLSDIGRGIGEGIRNLKKGLREDDPVPAPAPVAAPAPAPVAVPAPAAAPAPSTATDANPLASNGPPPEGGGKS